MANEPKEEIEAQDPTPEPPAIVEPVAAEVTAETAELPAAEAEAVTTESTAAEGESVAAEPESTAPEPVVKRRVKSAGRSDQHHGLGRRKSSVARVLLRPGEGRWWVNGRTLEEYFPRPVLRQSVVQPLTVTDLDGSFDVRVRVRGGGQRGQADAVRLGLARALLAMDGDHRSRLRQFELLTRDPREVERKKPGRPKARKRFQFSKR